MKRNKVISLGLTLICSILVIAQENNRPATVKIISPAANSMVSGDSFSVIATAEIMVGRPESMTLSLNGKAWATLSQTMSSGIKAGFSGSINAAELGYGDIEATMALTVSRAGGIRETVTSSAVKFKTARIDWPMQGGGGTRNAVFDDTAIMSGRVELDWMTELQGDIAVAPISDGKRLYYLIEKSSAEGRTLRMICLSVDTGETFYDVPVLNIMETASGLEVERYCMDTEAGLLYFLIESSRTAVIKIFSAKEGRALYSTDILPFFRKADILLCAKAGQSQLLAGGYTINADRSLQAVVYGISSTGLVQELANRPISGDYQSLPPEFRPIIVALPGTKPLNGNAIALVLSSEILLLADPSAIPLGSDPYRMDAIALPSMSYRKIARYPLFAGSGNSGMLYCASEDGYACLAPIDSKYELQPNYTTIIQHPGDFSVYDKTIYRYSTKLETYGDSYYLETYYPESDERFSIWLSGEAEYDRENFFHGFATAPLVGKKYIAALDRNYKLYLIERSELRLPTKASVYSITAPERVILAKINSKRLPFGYAVKHGSGTYYRQPELVSVSNRIIITTGEDSPNFAIAYKMR